MNALEMEEWRKVGRTKKCKVGRPNNKLVTGAKMIYKRKVKDDEVEKYRCQLVGFWQVEEVYETPTPATA